jgi:UDP-galactopyranose mutase
MFNLPFNMNTFYQMWGIITPAEAMEKIRQQSASVKGCPKNLEEQAILLVGEDIYQTLIKGYTEKQWGRSCTELPTSIISRLPVRFTYDNNYFHDKYQGIPEGGYNRLISRLLTGTECKTSCNYFYDKLHFNSLADKIIYTGPIDEYYGYRIGRLEYRSLTFEDEIIPTANFQGSAMVNYTDSSVSYTRIIEHKHFDISNPAVFSRPVSVITREHPIYPSATCDPYYPIRSQKNISLYESYLSLSKQEPSVIFGGRLGQYRYMNMDETIASAFSTFNHIYNNVCP